MIANTHRWTWICLAALGAFGCSGGGGGPPPEECLQTCCDADEDGYGRGSSCLGADCDDGNPAIYPGAPERCDGVDNDCAEGGLDVAPIDCAPSGCEVEGGVHFLHPAEVCTAGECVPQSPVSCGAFVCATAGDDGACGTTCADDGQCAPGAHCDAGGCIEDVADGGVCDEDSDCASGHCGDGFCCSGGECCQQASDCATYGTIAPVCDSAATCQGTRGTVSCEASTCVAASAVPDDSACDATIVASECGLYPAVHCTGAADQPSPVCATTCADDAGCDANAHCSGGACVADVALGGACTDGSDCEAGLFCADGVCCSTACSGTCEACDLTGSVGTCAAIPAGTDPDAECPGVSCSSYYFGWTGDSCYRKADVSAAQATCSGARSCRTTAEECSSQTSPAAPAVTCDALCQDPALGTCTGTTAGSCTNVDQGLATCGEGACLRSAPRCVNGRPNACIPGVPAAEVCNDVDDDCDGSVDDGSFADVYEPNDSCAAYKSLTQVGSDQTLEASATLYGSGDVDVFRIHAAESDDSCTCCDPICGEDYRLTITLAVPAGAGSYEFCAGAGSCAAATNCVFVSAGSSHTLTVNLDGSCIVGDAYDVYVTVGAGSAPGYECRGYTLTYTFDAGLCL